MYIYILFWFIFLYIYIYIYIRIIFPTELALVQTPKAETRKAFPKSFSGFSFRGGVSKAPRRRGGVSICACCAVASLSGSERAGLRFAHLREQLLHRSVQRFRGGLVFKAHRLCVSLDSRLESNKEEEAHLRSTGESVRSPPAGAFSFSSWCRVGDLCFRVQGFGFRSGGQRDHIRP